MEYPSTWPLALNLWKCICGIPLHLTPSSRFYGNASMEYHSTWPLALIFMEMHLRNTLHHTPSSRFYGNASTEYHSTWPLALIIMEMHLWNTPPAVTNVHRFMHTYTGAYIVHRFFPDMRRGVHTCSSRRVLGIWICPDIMYMHACIHRDVHMDLDRYMSGMPSDKKTKKQRITHVYSMLIMNLGDDSSRCRDDRQWRFRIRGIKSI